MAEEVNEAIAYLRALKQAANAQVAGSAAPASEAGPYSQASSSGDSGPHGIERRHHPRYKCDGSVELRETGCDVRTFASFTDISLGGCYIEAQATYPVGTTLHMKLQANGFKIETKGLVRVNYPYLGMGIAFIDMPEESRTRLKELLCSISPTCGIMGPGIACALPTAEALEEMPAVSNPDAAIRALAEFFQNHQMLIREDFLRILRASESPKTP